MVSLTSALLWIYISCGISKLIRFLQFFSRFIVLTLFQSFFSLVDYAVSFYQQKLKGDLHSLRYFLQKLLIFEFDSTVYEKDSLLASCILNS